jgi:shikimate kinase
VTIPISQIAAGAYQDAVTEARQFHNVALIGFMGAGKSTVGAFVASLLHFELVDTDKVIEEREGRRVSEIFAALGEPAFRALEAGLARELESRRGCVIATGGGLPLDPANFASLRRHAFLVGLWARPETIYQRVRHQTHRPLLQGPEPLARIRELLDLRAPVYRQADLLVGVDYRAPLETARSIVSAFRQARAARTPIHAQS